MRGKRLMASVLAVVMVFGALPLAGLMGAPAPEPVASIVAPAPEPDTIWLDERYDFIASSTSIFSAGIARGTKDRRFIYRVWGTEEERAFRTDEEARDSTEILAYMGAVNNWGYIDASGREVIPFIYDSIGQFSENVAMAGKRVSPSPGTNGNAQIKYGLIDREGNELTPFIYDRVEDFSDGLAKVQEEKPFRNGSYGFIDTKGNMVIPFVYVDAWSFSEGLAAVWKREGGHSAWGYIDTTGEEAIPFVFDRAFPFVEGLARIEEYEEYEEYPHLDFDIVGMPLVFLPPKKVGFIDQEGNVVIPCIYDEASDFSDGVARVVKDDIESYIDQTGKEAMPPAPYPREVFSEGLAPKWNIGGTKLGYVDEAGNEIIPYIYDAGGRFSEGLAAVKKDGYWGYIDQSGREAIPFIYEDQVRFSEGLALVKKEGRWGIIRNTYTVTTTLDGNYVEFDHAPILHDGCTLVPFHTIAEALGATLAWGNDGRTMTASTENMLILVQIDDGKMQMERLPSPNATYSEAYDLVEWDVPPTSAKDIVYVPLRAIAEAFGARVEWEGSTKTVMMTR